jgi:hypothetical protein
MPFATDMPAVARRYFAAAEELNAGTRNDVADYLYGDCGGAPWRGWALAEEAGAAAAASDRDSHFLPG